MSSNPPNLKPGLQYPAELEENTPTGAAIRNIFDNLFYLRHIAENPVTAIPGVTAQIQQIVQKITLNPGSGSSSTPTPTPGLVVIGTHKIRISTYGNAQLPVGTLFFEYDRNATYVISDSTGIPQWIWQGGIMEGALVNVPTGLGVNDIGFTYVTTDAGQITQYVWNGTAFITTGGYLQEVDDATTNVIATLEVKTHGTSGVAATGFGAGRVIQVQDAAGTKQTSEYDTVAWTANGTGTNDILMSWWLRIVGVLTQMLTLGSAGLSLLMGNYIWKASVNFTGTLTHANTGNRVYTFADETGNIVYQVAGLTDHAIVLGSGGGAKVKAGTLGTTTTVLHGNAAGDPTYSAVALANDVTGVLPIANGGTSGNTAAAARAALSAAQIQAPGGPHTITLAKITGGGANGSITFTVEGVVTGFVDPT